MRIPARGILAAVALVLTAAATEAPFGLAQVQERARALAAAPYRAPAADLPAWMLGLNYEQHREIRFDPAHAVWADRRLPFQLQFFHPGWLFRAPVRVHEVVDGRDREVEFAASFFKYDPKVPAGPVPEHLGFAGLRVHYDLNKPGDELAVFLGASYFRAIGRGMYYGLSARGLAVNTGEPGDEEFPRFTEFWAERPAAGAATLKVWALLDSPSVAGAYEFTIAPGASTVMDVRAAVYFRRRPAVVGLAPLTSMFEHGENTGWSRRDFRPEVHDSDGLLLQTGAGEWIWRPLDNPARTRVASFLDRAPKGFGLLQRDREFSHYDDVEANYHLRPSAWVEPAGDWGEGAVRLLEISTQDETSDNIVACWVPAKLPAPGEPLAFAYRLHWALELPGHPPGGHVAATRQGAVLNHPDRRRVVVDFTGGDLDRDAAEPEPVVSVGAGAILAAGPGIQRIGPSGLWRVVFELAPDGSGRPAELRCFLRRKKDILTETWSQLWSP